MVKMYGFSSERKMASAVVLLDGKHLLYCKARGVLRVLGVCAVQHCTKTSYVCAAGRMCVHATTGLGNTVQHYLNSVVKHG